MSQLQKIFDGAEGVKFITPQDFPFQVGLLAHPAKTELRAHSHKKLKIETDIFQEILIIQKGKVEINLFGMENKPLKSIILNAGDSVLFVRRARRKND